MRRAGIRAIFAAVLVAALGLAMPACADATDPDMMMNAPDSAGDQFGISGWQPAAMKQYVFLMSVMVPDSERDPVVARALPLLESGDIDGAIAIFDDAQKHGGLGPHGYAWRAVAHAAKQNNPEGVDDDFAHALQLDPHSSDALLMRAFMEFAGGSHDAGLADLAAFSQIDPNSAPSHWVKAVMLMGKPDRQGALAEYTSALSVDAAFWPALIGRGAIETSNLQLDKALEDLNRATGLAPDSPLGYASRCDAFAFLHDYGRALADCQRALSLSPASAMAHAAMASLRVFTHDVPGARAEVDLAIADSPNNAELYVMRAGIDDRLSPPDVDAERADFDHAISLDPQFALAFAMRCELSVLRGQVAQAMPDCTQALALQPDLPEALVGRGLCYSALGHFDLAVADLERSISIVPSSTAYADLGKIYADHNEQEKASQYLDKAIALDPDDPDGHRTRASVDFYLGNFPKAISDAAYATQFGDDDALMYAVQGYSAFATQDFDGAIAAFRQRRLKDPNSAYAALWLYLSEQRAGHQPDDELRRILEQLNPAAWPAPVAQFLTGATTEDSVDKFIATADERRASGYRCEEGFFAGEESLARNDKTHARAELTQAAQLCPYLSPSGIVAHAELARLQ